MGRRWWLGAVLALVVLGGVLAGCSDDGDDGEEGGGEDAAAEGEDPDAGAPDPSDALCQADVLVFLQPGTDDAAVDGVEAVLEAEPEVDTWTELDEAATQPIYEAIFPDAPPDPDPSQLPTSLAVRLRGNVDAALFVGDLYEQPGVGEVATVDGQACQIVEGAVTPEGTAAP